MTNFERIKTMTVEEFAEIFGSTKMLEDSSLCQYIQKVDPEHCGRCLNCKGCTLDWLNKEAPQDE